MENMIPKRIVLPPYDTYDVSTFAVHNGVVYIGHFGGSSDDDGHRLPTVEEQALQTFKNLENALNEIGLGLPDLVKVTVILRDISDFDKMHGVWKQVFLKDQPVRTTLTSDFVDAHCRIQVEGIAATR